MNCSVIELRDFYNSEVGKLVRDILMRDILEFWRDVHGLRVMGCGYTIPYLGSFRGKSPERIISMMPKGLGVEYWPLEDKNLSFCSAGGSLPIETQSIDRALIVHYLEGVNDLKKSIEEIWRVMKPNGKVLVVVPNRTGAWAHREWSPFGHGRPFTYSQMISAMHENLFEQKGSKGALFIPPVENSKFLLRFASMIEGAGNSVLPFVAGVHMIEFRKNVYANVDRGGPGSKVLSKTRELLGGAKPVPQGFERKDL